MFVEARADVAKVIVDACLAATLQVVTEETSLDVDGPCSPKQLPALGDEASEGSRVDNPNGKLIQFDPKRGNYEVIYTDDEGVARRSIRGLAVKCQDNRGKSLPADACDELMTRAYNKAKQLWNQLDRSERPRFEVEYPGTSLWLTTQYYNEIV